MEMGAFAWRAGLNTCHLGCPGLGRPSAMTWNLILYCSYDLKLMSNGLSLMPKPGEHNDQQPAQSPTSQSIHQDPQAYPLTESATIR